MLRLRTAAPDVPSELDMLRGELDQIGSGLDGVLDDLREISRGIHPAVLAEGGLQPALKTLARRSAIPVELDVRVDGRQAASVEAAATTSSPRH